MEARRHLNANANRPMRRGGDHNYLILSVERRLPKGAEGQKPTPRRRGCLFFAPAAALLGLVVVAAAASMGRQSAVEASFYQAALVRIEERLARSPEDHDAILIKSLLLLKTGRVNQARQQLNGLKTGAPTKPGAARYDLEQLRRETGPRLKAFLAGLPNNRIPSALLSLGESIPHAIVVDKASHRLYLYERAGFSEPPRLLRDFYVSTGKISGNKETRGDLRTPEGVYLITGHIPGEQLPDKYGIAAFPTDYPNEFDRRLGKTGDGIWLHGMEQVYASRPPLDSEGCVVLPNEDLSSVSTFLRPGSTPIVIADHVKWLEREPWRALQRELLDTVEHWRSDWESLDVERYLSHYAEDFWGPGYDLPSWAKRKRRLAQGKRYQEVKLSDLSLFAYPLTTADGRELAVVQFRQDYRSSNYSDRTDKRLYLAKQDGRWQVLYEGPQ